eukprot:820429-Pyramimonas_sp.AAC.1
MNSYNPRQTLVDPIILCKMTVWERIRLKQIFILFVESLATYGTKCARASSRAHAEILQPP